MQAANSKNSNRVVIRIRTTTWSTARGVHRKKELLYLRRPSLGHNFVAEDASVVNASELVNNIVNFDSVTDGVYEVITVNEHRDWETGYLDSWEYKLVPYEDK